MRTILNMNTTNDNNTNMCKTLGRDRPMAAGMGNRGGGGGAGLTSDQNLLTRFPRLFERERERRVILHSYAFTCPESTV